MNNSLVQIIMQIFGSQMISRIATSLGINPTLAQTLANAAIPTVLASLANAASTPAGAQRIAQQVQNQDSNILGQLVNAIGGPNQSSFLNSGAGMLSSLLGSGAGNLAEPLAKFAGVPAAQAQSMLGLVAPATFGALAQQDPQIWSSGDGIANLFKREQSAISAAIPSGLASSLGATGLFNSLPGMLGVAGQAASAASSAAGAVEAGAARARDAVSSAASNVSSAASHAASGAANAAAGAANEARQRAEAAVSGGLPGWAKLAIPALLLALLAWFFWPKPAPAPAPTPPARTGAAPAAPAATQAAVDLAAFAQKTNSTLGGLVTTLTGITSLDQAKAATAKLTESATDLAGLGESFGKLPEAARKEMAGPMQAVMNTLREQITRVLGIPGVSDLIKPVLDKLLAAAAAFKA